MARTFLKLSRVKRIYLIKNSLPLVVQCRSKAINNSNPIITNLYFSFALMTKSWFMPDMSSMVSLIKELNLRLCVSSSVGWLHDREVQSMSTFGSLLIAFTRSFEFIFERSTPVMYKFFSFDLDLGKIMSTYY